jgi:hypothetical protein
MRAVRYRVVDANTAIIKFLQPSSNENSKSGKNNFTDNSIKFLDASCSFFKGRHGNETETSGTVRLGKVRGGRKKVSMKVWNGE